MTRMVTATQVRDYLNQVSSTTSNQYSDATINSNIDMAQSALEFAVGRYIAPRSFTAQSPWLYTTMNQNSVPLPGFRTFTSVSRTGATLTANAGYWAVPDSQQTGVFTRMYFRAPTSPDFWPGQMGTPYGPWITNPLWFDFGADSPFYPTNLGGNYYLTSLPRDLEIVGEAGYDVTIPADTYGGPPSIALMAIRAKAAWLTMRPASIMADVAITAAGGVINFSAEPPEVQAFIAAYKGATPQMTTVG